MSETSEDMEAYAALYEASLERNNNNAFAKNRVL
jgi:hypothetical protein